MAETGQRQWSQALEKANAIRINRAEMKRGFKDDEGRALEVLKRPPVYAEGMRVDDFLMAIPMVGMRRTKQMLRRCLIPEHKTLAQLSGKQREELAYEIEERNWL